MKLSNSKIALIASVSIGILTIPTINNLPLPEFVKSFGTLNVALLLGVLTMAGYLFSEFLSKWISVFRQIGRFAVVGILNTVLDFAVFNVLISSSGVAEGMFANLFKGTAFVIAVINSYYWNKYWTFGSDKTIKGKEFIQFIVISVIGFGINVGVFSLVVNFIEPLGGISPVAWANLGALAGTLIGLAWNFLGYKLVVFKK